MVPPGTNGRRRGYNRAAEVLELVICVAVAQPTAAREQRGEHDGEGKIGRNLKAECQLEFIYTQRLQGLCFVSLGECVRVT